MKMTEKQPPTPTIRESRGAGDVAKPGAFRPSFKLLTPPRIAISRSSLFYSQGMSAVEAMQFLD
jgi:hypothetical protein